jgi:predicted kinase
VLQSNAQHLRHLAPVLGAAAVEGLIVRTSAIFEAQRDRLDRRLADGLVRECHGDLHLGNILLEDGRAVLFDRIEFNVRLIEIDILYDVAFTLMDLVFRGRPGPANRALNGWLDAASRLFPPAALYDGLEALPLFLSVRAAVRCHVCGHNGQPDAARAYLAAADRHLLTLPPQLLAIGGLSGSGKSTLARALAPRLGAPPGAVVLRSDEVRKRLYGRSPMEPLPIDAYAPEADARIHAALFEAARQVLAAGFSVILDATFRDPARRAEALALHPGARGVWLDAPDAVLRARVAGRSGDASDADLAVLERQLSARPRVQDWPSVDAAAPVEAQCAAVLSG